MNIFYKKIFRLFRTFILNIIIITVFTIIYLNMSDEFVVIYGKKQEITFIDCLFTSTSIQSGVGLTSMMPVTNTSKWAMIAHQILMITTHLLSVIFFVIL